MENGWRLAHRRDGFMLAGHAGPRAGHHGFVVIPVHDVNPLRRTPWITYALVAANAAVLLLTPVALGTVAVQPGPAALCRQAAFYDHYAAIPHELVTNAPLRLVPTGQLVAGSQGPGCLLRRPSYQKSPPLSVSTGPTRASRGRRRTLRRRPAEPRGAGGDPEVPRHAVTLR
jgi:hypothetical protein